MISRGDVDEDTELVDLEEHLVDDVDLEHQWVAGRSVALVIRLIRSAVGPGAGRRPAEARTHGSALAGHGSRRVRAADPT
jgi:hypothetical protein